MPSYPPRTETVKKQDQLSQREEELQHVLRKNFAHEKLTKAVEKYRAALLSLLKAKIHMAQEKEFEKKSHSFSIESIEKKIEIWKKKTEKEIINEFKKK